MKHMKIKNFQNFGKLHFPKLFKKAKFPRIFSFIIVVLVVILLIFLIKNGWDIKATAQDMLGMVGGSKK